MAITVFRAGKKIQLGDADYLAAGGEATVYLKDDLVYKIFDQPPASDYRRKLGRLGALAARSSIIAPLAPLDDQHGRLVGYAMPAVPDAMPLPKLFTSAFQLRAGIGTEYLNHLVTGMIETIRFIHANGILMVDGNELNYLLSGTPGRMAGAEVKFIDVDSWQLEGFPAPVIMPSIRDWSSDSFSPGSDWFAFGVIICQLYVGIHPFKGRWQGDPGLTDLKQRVLQRLSVFNRQVSVPSATRPFDRIPVNLREWLVDLFEHGGREVPPMPGAVPHWVPIGFTGKAAAALTLELLPAAGGDEELVRGAGLEWLLDLEAGPVLRCRGRTEFLSLAEFGTARFLVIAGRLYAVTGRALVELDLRPLGAHRRVVEVQRWPLASQGITAGDGVVLADYLGAAFAYLPWRTGHCALLRVPELDGHRLVSAAARGRVIMAVSVKAGQYFRTQWHLDTSHATVFRVSQEAVEAPVDLHFVVLNETLLIEYLEGDRLRLSPVGQAPQRVVTDCGLEALNLLASDGKKVLARLGSDWYRLGLAAE